MAGEGRLLEAIVKRAKVRQDANRNPNRVFQQKMKNSAQTDVPPDTSEGNMNVIDQNVSTPTQSELQDIRGVPDQELDEIRARNKPGPMLHETTPDPTDRLLRILQARKIAPTSTTDPRGLSKLQGGAVQANNVRDQVKQFFDTIPDEDRETLLYELLGGTSRSPE